MCGATPSSPVPGEAVPHWDTHQLESRPCVVCISKDRSTFSIRPDGLAVARCLGCGALFLPLVPNDEELRRYYLNYSKFKPYLGAQADQGPPLSLGHKFKASVAKSSAWRFARKVVLGRRSVQLSADCEILMRTGGLAGKVLLELGPGGDGGLLPEAMAWGSKGVAVEVDSDVAAAIRSRGIDVFGHIADVRQRVDIVYASMVLEHLVDPLQTLRAIARTMNPGGRIFVRVPNAGQVASRGPNWIGFRVDLEHLNYFEERSLTALLEGAGFLAECSWQESQPILASYHESANRLKFLSELARGNGQTIAARPTDPLQAGTYSLSVLARL